ncbi:DUF4157 domain-containing protein [Mycolicibacterium sp. CR10]|uniref:eCIS core domain-containing protein n=1 Tax=Mycolicibacterium sp. CR10 TaxID=2562314 RepID=UPI00197BBA1D|nr:DUF4157 domain-containing protein [Mycolicibacterium sp. CR10]
MNRSQIGHDEIPGVLGNRATVGLLDRGSAYGAAAQGDPLPDGIRRTMAAALGDPLSDVRIRTDADAAGRARELRAAAVTEGRQISFAPGRYRPDTAAGRQLLAHEIVHTAQNRWLPPRTANRPPAAISRPTDASERQAHALSAALAPSLASARSALVAPMPVAFSPAVPTALLQRAGEDEVGSADAPGAGGMTSKHGASTVGTAPPAMSMSPSPAAPVEPGGPTIVVDGVTLSESPAYVRKQLLDYIAAQGTQKALDLQQHLESSVTTQSYNVSDQSGVSDERQRESDDLALRKRVLEIVKAELKTISGERDKFLADFQEAAEKNVRMILDESEGRVHDEMDRYRIVITTTVTEGYSMAMKEKTSKVTKTYRMGDNEETKGLATAARELADKRRAIRKLESSRSALEHIQPSYDEYTPAETYVQPEDQAQYDRLGEDVGKAEKEYDLLRATNTEDFPMLAAFADTRDPETLDKLAGGSSESTAQVIGKQVEEVLENIRTVRDGLGGRFSIWKQQPVVDATKSQFLEITWEHKWIDEKVTEVKEDQALSDLLWSALAIGLGLLAAIPSGGSSLIAAGTAVAAIGAAGVSSYLAFQHALDYNMAAAAAKTDFDKARAISQEEPSLFWLALDIVGAALDIGAAAKAFKAALALRRTAVAAEVLGDAAVSALKAEGNKIGQSLEKPLPNLGDRLAEDVAKRRKSVDTALQDASKEANAAAETGKAIEAGATATPEGSRLGRAAQRLKAAMADLIERIKAMAAKVWEDFGFKYFTVEVKSEWVEIYGHSSPGVLIARFKLTLFKNELVTETETLERLRHSRSSQLGKAAVTVDEELAAVLRGNATRLSETIGEKAGEQVVRRYFKAQGLKPRRIFHGHGSGVLDMVFELEDGTIVILEAKGGAGKIGLREIAPGQFAEQGHRQYLTSILDNMEKGYPDIVAKIRSARRRPGGLKYLYSSTPIPDAGSALKTTVKEFTL